MNATSAGRVRDGLAAVVLFLATAAFTLWQNSRVAVLWDISYLLDTSYRISLGQLPYRDFPFAHAPLTFLLHAAIIKLYGRVYFPHILCAALEAGAATVFTWRILLNVLVPVEQRLWATALLLAAPLTVIGIYGIYPHPIYDSDCILAVLLAIYLIQRADSSVPRNFLAGSVCVLPLFFKQNIGLPFLLITLAAAAIISMSRGRQRAAIAPQVWFLAGVMLTLAAALASINATVGLRNYFYWTVTFAAHRRLPGIGLILTIYRQASLIWTIPAAVAGIALLLSDRVRLKRWAHPCAILLIALPFLCTIATLTFTTDVDERSDQLLSVWPHLLILATLLALYNLSLALNRANSTISTMLPLVLVATIHGAFLSQQLWGSTYAIWPLLMILIAAMLSQIPAISLPLAAVIAATLLLCGGLYASSHERLSYVQLNGAESRATLSELRGLTTPGTWIPAFEELVRVTNAEIPAGDGILLLPGEDPFYFAIGRTPQFPVLLFDPATDPYTPHQTLDQARADNIRWLIVTRNFQLTASPKPDLPDVLRVLQQDFAPYRTLTNYDIYHRR